MDDFLDSGIPFFVHAWFLNENNQSINFTQHMVPFNVQLTKQTLIFGAHSTCYLA